MLSIVRGLEMGEREAIGHLEPLKRGIYSLRSRADDFISKGINLSLAVQFFIIFLSK